MVNNDAVSWRALSRSDFDAIVLSPGPGRPETRTTSASAGRSSAHEIPVLGICLGHQGLGTSRADGRARARGDARAAQPRPPRRNRPLRGIPQDFPVVRYHSLAWPGRCRDERNVTAWADDGVVMGVEHARGRCGECSSTPSRSPPSTAAALARTSATWRRWRAAAARASRRRSDAARAPRPRRAAPAATSRQALQLESAAIDRLCDPSAPSTALRGAAARLLARQRRRADALAVLLPRHQRRPARRLLEYDVDAGEVRVERRRGGRGPAASRSSTSSTASSQRLRSRPPAAARPDGGFVGYLGYELKADCGAPRARVGVPDAALMLANRLVAVDHVEQTHLRALPPDARDEAAGRALARRGEPQRSTALADRPPGADAR